MYQMMFYVFQDTTPCSPENFTSMVKFSGQHGVYETSMKYLVKKEAKWGKETLLLFWKICEGMSTCMFLLYINNLLRNKVKSLKLTRSFWVILKTGAEQHILQVIMSYEFKILQPTLPRLEGDIMEHQKKSP